MKKTLFLFAIIIQSGLFAQDSIYYSPDPQGNGTMAYKAIVYNGGQIVNAYNVAQIPKNWKGLKTSLFHSALFMKAISQANANAYSTLLKVLTDGENGDGNEANLLLMINMLGMTFTVQEKAELNGYFQANNFTIRL